MGASLPVALVQMCRDRSAESAPHQTSFTILQFNVAFHEHKHTHGYQAAMEAFTKG